jgi:phage gpG-like protein
MNRSIELSSEARAIIARTGDPQVLLGAIAKELDLQNNLTLGHIQEKRLTGKGPYPVEQHRLGERSKHYRKSIRTSASEVVGSTVTGAIGANLAYAGIHETGGTIQRTVKPGKVRLRTDRKGSLLGQRTNPRLAVFARKSQKSVREVAYLGGRSYTIKIPARAPIGTGIEDRLQDTGNAISNAIVKAWEGAT